MVKSKSGVLRQALGPARSHLVNNYNYATQNLSNVVLSADTVVCQKQADDIQEYADKIRGGISSIMERDKQWQELIVALDETELAEEEEIYTKTALDPKDGYLHQVEIAKELVCRLDRKLAEANRRLATPPPAPATAIAAAAAPSDTTDKKTITAKLPKLSLPVFSGDYCDWPSFWNIFKTSVHDQRISAAEKFAYLRGQLSPTALKPIEGISIEEKNYDIALSVLRARYERSAPHMVGTLYSQLKRLPVSTTKVSDLRDTYDGCERVFRLLEAAGEDVNANRSLTLDVFSKYPRSVLRELLEKHNIGTHSSLGDVRAALQKYLSTCENMTEILQDLDPFGSSNKQQPSRGKPDAKATPTWEVQQSGDSKQSLPTSAFAVAAPNKMGNARAMGQSEQSEPHNPCYFCEDRHFNSKCTKYQSADDRVGRLQALERCTKCMSTAHKANECRATGNRLRCFFCKTTGQHVSPLCPSQFGSIGGGPNADTGVNAGTKVSNLLTNSEQSLLLTAVAKVFNPQSQSYVHARIIFDSGSHRSFITAATSDKLHLSPLSANPLDISVFGSEKSVSVPSEKVCFEIEERDGKRRSIEAHTTPVITSSSIPPCELPREDRIMITQMKWQMADDYDSPRGVIDILIGSDHFWEFISGARQKTPSGLFLIPSTVGYLVGGRCEKSKTSNEDRVALLCFASSPQQGSGDGNFFAASQSVIPPPGPDVDQFWNLETIGIADDPVVRDDDEALNHFNKSIVYKEGRYHVGWPWKQNRDQLPCNYELALGRFKSLAKRLRSSEPEILQKYAAVISDQLQKGVIERVSTKEAGNEGGNTIHYLPHHPVVKPSSATTKVRVVYDASAKTRKDNPLLNECLYRGPVLLPDLCQILIRFRTKPVGIVADVEKAFLQMSLRAEDRDVTRFLWFRDPNNPSIENNLAIYRFCRVLFGAISSPFLLAATILFHLGLFEHWAARMLERNTYVDNAINNLESTEMAVEFYRVAKDMSNKAGMNLQEWASNDDEFLQTIPVSDRTASRDIKVLGLHWDCEDDTLRIKQGVFGPVKTKREALRWLAAVYDPLGFFQPVLIRAKIFLQNLWLTQCGWDSAWNPTLQEKWDSLQSDIEPIFNMRIPRSPHPQVSKDVGRGGTSLVVFCDASACAYATTVYLRRYCPSEGRWYVNMVFCKSRLAPKKIGVEPVTLPRLELLGVTIGARAATFVKNALSSESEIPVFLFTDSMFVLHWLRSPKLLSVFVGNRVTEIKKLQNAEFLYVNTTENPADYGTRGKTAKDLQRNDLWWSGPAWLQMGRSEWPESCVVGDREPVSEEAIGEFRKCPQTDAILIANEVEIPANNGPFGIDPSKFSSFSRLVRVTAWCFKFIKICIFDHQPAQTAEAAAKLGDVAIVSSERILLPGDLSVARISIIRSTQADAFPGVLRALNGNGKNSLVKQLGLQLDERGIVRCHGRFQHADLPYDSKNPQLLPKCHVVTNLIIRSVHERVLHAGVGHTLSQTRRQFWVPQDRAAVRKTLKRCTLCRKHKGAPFALPRMPPWPKDRVARSKPFQFIGLDYMGPVSVRVGEATQKMWVCLFTCLATRAVHLECVSDCSAKAFMFAVERFFARRGTPEQIISDNAPQFHATKITFDRMWHAVMRDSDVQAYYSENGITWKFTTELAPWQGGFYERLVGIVKGLFKTAVGRRLLHWEELLTLITEVEAIVNSRPITYVYGDFDSGLPLRPCDFLTELAVGMPATTPQLHSGGLGDASRDLVRLWKHKQGRLNAIWKQWYDEYLLSLRERGSDRHKARKGEILGWPAPDDVVVKESDAPRGNWKLGRVTDIIVGKYGKVRSAQVLLPNKNILRRPINHLYPIELPPAYNDDIQLIEQDEEFTGFDLNEVQQAVERVDGYRAQREATNNINQGLVAVAATIMF